LVSIRDFFLKHEEKKDRQFFCMELYELYAYMYKLFSDHLSCIGFLPIFLSLCVCVCVSALTLDWLILAYYCQRSISKTSCRLSLPLIDPTV